jgi:Tol biopolymer transport system component/DNA-binding winged helix-turn-helix (wHTH) protein
MGETLDNQEGSADVCLEDVPVRFRWDDFVLDLDAYRLERDGIPLALEPKAFNLLAAMVQRPHHLFTKQEIFDLVWPGTAVTDHALTRIVAQIRRVVRDEAREARYLETVPTRGYRWIAPIERVDVPVASDNGRAANEEIARIEPRIEASAVPVPAKSRLITVVAAFVSVAVVVIAALVWERGRVSLDQSPVNAQAADAGGHGLQWPVQVTTNAGLDLHPALSPQGDAIAFVSDRTGSFEIHVRALEDGATETPLTADEGQNVQPAWSPDGRFIAYHSYRRGGIWIVPSRGGTPRQIVPEGSKPAWSPDGASIAFQSDEHADVAPKGAGAQSGSNIRLVKIDGGVVTDLTHSGNPAGGHAAPSWSPDGRYVSFAVFDAGPDNGLWLLDRTTQAVAVLHRGENLFESVFAPNGSWIYVAGGEAFITMLPFDGATGTVPGRHQIIPVPRVPGVRGLTISPDGSRVALAGLGLTSQIWAQRVTAEGEPVGAARALTTDTSHRNSLPVVSPDGAHVAYMSSRAGEQANVWVMNIDGGSPMQLTTDSAFDSQPAWSADGRRILYQSKGGEEKELLSVDVQTRQTAPVIAFSAMAQSSAARLAEARLSRSVTRMAFTVREPPSGRRAMFVTALDPIAPRRLTDGSVSAGYPAWSPDDRRLAVEIKEGSSTHAGLVNVDTGTLSRLTSARGQTWVRSWSPDGKKVAAAVLRDGRWSLRALDADGGAEHVMTSPGPSRVFVRYPDWSPRGDLVVYERGEMTGNIWFLSLRGGDAR